MARSVIQLVLMALDQAGERKPDFITPRCPSFSSQNEASLYIYRLIQGHFQVVDWLALGRRPLHLMFQDLMLLLANRQGCG